MGLCAGWAGNWLVGFGANQYLYKPKQTAKKEVRATPFLLQPEGIEAFLRFLSTPDRSTSTNPSW